MSLFSTYLMTFRIGSKAFPIVALALAALVELLSQQPHQLNIPTGFLFQQPAGAKAVEITINKQLQQIPRMVRRPPSIVRDGMFKPKHCQVQTIHERVDEADGIICTNIFV